MKKNDVYFLVGLLLTTLSLPLEGVSNPPTANQNQTVNEKFDLMERDENEDSDTLAIPFDDSEVEDEEEINAIEKKNVFDLPRGHSKH